MSKSFVLKCKCDDKALLNIPGKVPRKTRKKDVKKDKLYQAFYPTRTKDWTARVERKSM